MHLIFVKKLEEKTHNCKSLFSILKFIFGIFSLLRFLGTEVKIVFVSGLLHTLICS